VVVSGSKLSPTLIASADAYLAVIRDFVGRACRR
jgi:hypothetical protein